MKNYGEARDLRVEKQAVARRRNRDIRVYKDGKVRVRDADDNRYTIYDYRKLDSASRARLLIDI